MFSSVYIYINFIPIEIFVSSEIIQFSVTDAKYKSVSDDSPMYEKETQFPLVKFHLGFGKKHFTCTLKFFRKVEIIFKANLSDECHCMVVQNNGYP